MKRIRQGRVVRLVVSVMGMVVFGWLGVGALALAETPDALRNPAPIDYTFRLRVLVGGRRVDMRRLTSSNSYCTGRAPVPARLYPGSSEHMQVRWHGLTGGQLLKYFGWDLIGGRDGSLGVQGNPISYRHIGLHVEPLPDLPDDARVWVYMATPDGWQLRERSDFIDHDIERFLGRAPYKTGWLQRLQAWVTPAARAHDQADRSPSINPLVHPPAAPPRPAEHDAAKIQPTVAEAIGVVVLFAQEGKPTQDQLTLAFADFEATPADVCVVL